MNTANKECLNHLVLASSSVARQNLLKQVNIVPNCVFSSDIDETKLAKESAQDYVTRLALLKAKVAKKEFANSYVVAADTVVYSQYKIIGKPKNNDEAFTILKSLMGRSHKVFTGYCVIAPDGRLVNKHCCSRVKFGNFTDSEIKNYIQNEDVLTKAGAYGLQGKGVLFVSSVIGSYSNVIGLPLDKVYNALKGLGYKSYLNSK